MVHEIRNCEPMMNKDINEVSLQVENDKVNKVVIYTNGHLPAGRSTLKNDKIFVFITTYGELSKNAEKLRANSISSVKKYQSLWLDGMSHHSRSGTVRPTTIWKSSRIAARSTADDD